MAVGLRPAIHQFHTDPAEDLIQVPDIPATAPSLPNPPRMPGTELQTPQPERLIGNLDSTIERPLLDIGMVETEVELHPYAVRAGFPWEAISRVAWGGRGIHAPIEHVRSDLDITFPPAESRSSCTAH